MAHLRRRPRAPPHSLCLGAFVLTPLLLGLALCAPRRIRAPAAVQEAERTALIALSSSLQPPPGSGGFWEGARWLPSPYPLPCQSPVWTFVNCSVQLRVMGINLNVGVVGAQLSGSIPWAQMGNLSYLNKFTINNQLITGTAFPNGMPLLPRLQILDMSYNSLASFTSEISQLPNLRVLLLQGNKMSGVLPGALSNLTALSILNLNYNVLTGSIPAAWASLKTLESINVQNTLLSGTLPVFFSAFTRLSFLNLDRALFTGTVPPAWSALNASLLTLQLATNNLSGSFPVVLTTLTTLTFVDISDNSFEGPVPNSVWRLPIDLSSNYFNGSVPSNRSESISLTANCFSAIGALSSGSSSSAGNVTQRSAEACTAFYALLYPTKQTGGSSPNIGLIVGISAGVTFLILVLAGLLFWCFQRSERLAKRLRKGTMQSTREFRISELKTATNNWSLELGRGGYGTVYKAVLKDKSVVAVKRLDLVSDQGDQEFIREVELLSRVHHRHLVDLVGFCGERGERALVYEYMGLGSLYEHLHGECAHEQPLSWDSRIKIAIHVAFGIDYLHYGADPPLIHRDIKSGNILLSDDGYAKVADFGLCKEAPVGVAVDGTAQLVPPATEVRGSFGYLDPEYVHTSVLSEKSDVYSYGVVLLELITGKKSIHDWQPLAYWAEPFLEDANRVDQLVDPALGDKYDVHELQILCDIARSCTYDQASQRPAIRDVAQALVENLGRVVVAGASEVDPSVLSSEEEVSAVDRNDVAEANVRLPTGTSTYTWRNAASEAIIVGPREGGEGGAEQASLRMARGPGGNKLPVPVGKFTEDTV